MPQELDDFDPREYLTAGDWQAALVRRGWHQAPGDIQSVRKDYFSPLGWRIHLWVERETNLAIAPEDTIIIAFGPNGTKLGSMWVGYDDALGDVDRLERLIQLDRPYEVVSDNVARFLGSKVSESEEDFDPRAYMMDDFMGLMQSLGYLNAGARSFAKTIHTPQVDFKVYWDGVDEPSQVQAGHVMVEARFSDYQQYPSWSHRGMSTFRVIFSHVFDGDPPLDVVKELDTMLTGWTSSLEAADGELMRLKSKLTALGDRQFKARKRVESLVNKLLDSEEPFDARQYVLDEPNIEALAAVLEKHYWQLTERAGTFGWKFRKLDVDIKGTTCDLSLFVLPEPAFESHVELFTVRTDANGFEHRERVPQQLWWEWYFHETFDDYAARISNGIAHEAKV